MKSIVFEDAKKIEEIANGMGKDINNLKHKDMVFIIDLIPEGREWIIDIFIGRFHQQKRMIKEIIHSLVSTNNTSGLTKFLFCQFSTTFQRDSVLEFCSKSLDLFDKQIDIDTRYMLDSFLELYAPRKQKNDLKISDFFLHDQGQTKKFKRLKKNLVVEDIEGKISSPLF
jgi:hypothetical protein